MTFAPMKNNSKSNTQSTTNIFLIGQKVKNPKNQINRYHRSPSKKYFNVIFPQNAYQSELNVCSSMYSL